MNNKITNQEAFNNVWQHFVVEENPPSLTSDAMRCMYRMEDGRACAIGIMIPDEMYDPEMEGSGGVYGLFKEFPQVADLFDHKEWFGWADLQSCHDQAAARSTLPFNEAIKKNLINFASMHNLIVPDAETSI